MDLGREATAGAADRMVRRLLARIPVIRPCPLCRPPGRGPALGGAVLVSAVDRRVDADVPVDLTDRVGVGEQRGMDPVPGSVGTEPAVPFRDRLPWSELTG